jgi:hypothetical protein
MRPSYWTRLALGVALIAAVIAIALALAQDHAEAPNRIDFLDAVDPAGCSNAAGVGPHLCLTDAPPTPTADTRDQRVELLSDPRLAAIVAAAESADVDALLKMTLKVNYCEYETRSNRDACRETDYIEAVQQPLSFARPALRLTETMREWLTNLLTAGSSRLDLAARSLPDGDLPPDAYVLIFKLPGRASPTESNGGEYGYVVIYLRLDAPQPIEQFSFLSWRSNPSEFLLDELDLAPISYELVLGQCHPDDRFHCK